FEEEVGLETTLKRPIINTRDEPHADAQKYRRLHVIAGDANMSETATFLKLGTTALILAMVEDDALGEPVGLARPVPAMHQVSRDLTLGRTLELDDGTTATALELQFRLLGRAEAYADRHGLDCLGSEEVGREVLASWRSVLEDLEQDPELTADRLDWVAKRRLVEGYRQRDGLDWTDPKLRALDLQYHDVRPRSSLARRVGLRRIVGDDEVEHATVEPPEDTRAYFRGRCLARFSEQVVAANWDSVVFDTGDATLQRVPMLEPGRGTRAHVGDLIDAADTAADLLEALGR
ncbi:MAG: proteasome accessory factor PafA2 family protein, partial [Acidobacteria bacterium]|nr:proteasome accessory factor PafA2 family protein [Acidobacteriota bacterium]